MNSDADKTWERAIGKLRRKKGYGPLTPDEAEADVLALLGQFGRERDLASDYERHRRRIVGRRKTRERGQIEARNRDFAFLSMDQRRQRREDNGACKHGKKTDNPSSHGLR